MPVLIVVTGFWYGSFKVTSSTLQTILYVDKSNLRPATKYSSYLASAATGGTVLYLGRKTLSSLSLFDEGEMNPSTSTSNRMSKIKNLAKSMIPGKRGVATLFLSSFFAATSSVLVQKYW